MAIHLNRRVFGSVNSASMSDIAFLLLIFFLVTTIFSHEEGISMLLPVKAPPKKIQKSSIIIIQAHPNGAITVNDVPMTLWQLRNHVKDRLIANDKLVIVLETHPDTEYGLMIDILDELRLAEARRITLRKMDGSSRNTS